MLSPFCARLPQFPETSPSLPLGSAAVSAVFFFFHFSSRESIALFAARMLKNAATRDEYPDAYQYINEV